MIPILIPTQKLIIKNVLVSRELPTRHSRKAPCAPKPAANDKHSLRVEVIQLQIPREQVSKRIEFFSFLLTRTTYHK